MPTARTAYRSKDSSECLFSYSAAQVAPPIDGRIISKDGLASSG
jgi:hypothetical protein